MEPATKEQMQVLLEKFERLENKVHDYLDRELQKWLSCKQYAQKAGMDKSHVARLCRTGKLKAKQIGAKWLIDPKELEK